MGLQVDQFSENDTINVSPYAVTSIGRMDTDGTTQSFVLVHGIDFNSDDFDTQVNLLATSNGDYRTTAITFDNPPSIETNSVIATEPIRDQNIDMRIIASIVEPEIRNADDMSVLRRSRHVLVALVYDRSANNLSDTPLRLSNNLSSGAFEIPEGSGRFYNLIEFEEQADEKLTLTFESVQ